MVHAVMVPETSDGKRKLATLHARHDVSGYFPSSGRCSMRMSSYSPSPSSWARSGLRSEEVSQTGLEIVMRLGRWAESEPSVKVLAFQMTSFYPTLSLLKSLKFKA